MKPMDLKAIISLILFDLSLVAIEASTVTLTLSSANRSCERTVQEVRLQQQNITFPCWKQEVVPMQECDRAFSAMRHPPPPPAKVHRLLPLAGDAAPAAASRQAVGSGPEDRRAAETPEAEVGEQIDGPDDHFLPLSTAHRHRHRRDADVCFKNSLQKCHISVMVYSPVTVVEKICCSGYELNTANDTCQAVSTCMTNNGGCDQLCRQSDGKAVCSCYHGYELDADQRRCVDVNECKKNHGGCSHRCHNIPGTYYCSCPGGYGFNSPSSRNCTDVNECQFFNGGCEHKCVNTRGAFYCECAAGYRRKDGFRCISCDDDFSLTAGTVHTCAHLAREDDTVMVEDMGYMVVPFMVVLLLVVVGAHLAITSASKRAAARRAAVLRSLHEQFKNATCGDAIELPAVYNTPPPPYQPPATSGRVFTISTGPAPAPGQLGRAIRASSSSTV